MNSNEPKNEIVDNNSVPAITLLSVISTTFCYFILSDYICNQTLLLDINAKVIRLLLVILSTAFAGITSIVTTCFCATGAEQTHLKRQLSLCVDCNICCILLDYLIYLEASMFLDYLFAASIVVFIIQMALLSLAVDKEATQYYNRCLCAVGEKNSLAVWIFFKSMYIVMRICSILLIPINSTAKCIYLYCIETKRRDLNSCKESEQQCQEKK